MDMGSRIRKARLEAGLSQRQLCGDRITRNMLSQIENGSAMPSLQTLELLAQGLGKPMSYFFGETQSPSLLDRAWRAYEAGNLSGAEALLRNLPPEEGGGKRLRTLVLLDLAELAIREDRKIYARTLLNWAEPEGDPQLLRRSLLLRGQLPDASAAELCSQLPSLDEELKLRARAALENQNPQRAGLLLDAAEEPGDPEWSMLRGRVYFEEGSFRQAAQCFHRAEETDPAGTAPYLEQCYKELEDYRRAYFYACRQK